MSFFRSIMPHAVNGYHMPGVVNPHPPSPPPPSPTSITRAVSSYRVFTWGTYPPYTLPPPLTGHTSTQGIHHFKLDGAFHSRQILSPPQQLVYSFRAQILMNTTPSTLLVQATLQYKLHCCSLKGSRRPISLMRTHTP